jgi:hypothetical protein
VTSSTNKFTHLRQSKHFAQQPSHRHLSHRNPSPQTPPIHTLSHQPLPQPQAHPQWRLATQVHAQATTAAHTQTAATTTQETHATPDHPAATAAPHAIALLTPRAAAPEAATPTPTPTPTEPPSATPDQHAHAHPPAPLTTTLHANALLRAHLAAQHHPIPVNSANQAIRLKRLFLRL